MPPVPTVSVIFFCEIGDLQVLQVAPRELNVSHDLDLAISSLTNLNNIPKITNAAVNLNLVVEKFFEGRDVEDLIRGRLRSVDDELKNTVTKLVLKVST